MSSIAATSGNSEMYRMMQMMQRGVGSAGGGMPQPTAEMRAQMQAKMSAAGIDIQKLDGLKAQVGNAAKTALEESDGLSDDEKKANVQAAVDGVLKDNGIDPEQLKNQFKSMASSASFSGGFSGGMLGGMSGGGAGSSKASSENDLINSLLQQLQNEDGTTKADADVDFNSFFKQLPAGFLIDFAG